MHSTSISAFLALVASAVAAPVAQLTSRDTAPGKPFQFPLSNGFPNITSKAQLTAIEKQAGGPVPDTISPATLTPAATTIMQVIAFNEYFETAFFTELLYNITAKVPGFTDVGDYETVFNSVTASQGQEQLHTLATNAGLKVAKEEQVVPCAYRFPTSSFYESVTIIDDFTSMVLAGIGAVETVFALDGEEEATGLIPLFGAIGGQEGQQDGYYRYLLGKMPAANGFLTTTSIEYIYNHINQNYIVPGSCHTKINVPEFEILTPITAPPTTGNGTITFETTATGVDPSTMKLVLMSGQTKPIPLPISAVSVKGAYTTFTSEWPVEDGISQGLTIGALVHSGNGYKFETVSDVTYATVAGPALIQLG